MKCVRPTHLTRHATRAALIHTHRLQKRLLTARCTSHPPPPNSHFVVTSHTLTRAGITSGFWIWSAKTVESWTSFKDRVLCNRQQRSTQQQQQHINHSLVGARYHRATPSGSDSSRQHQQQQQVVGAGGAMSYDAHQQMPLYIPSAQHRGGGL